MFNTSKLSPLSMTFLQNLPSRTIGKPDLLSMALGKVISSSLSLPSGNVINPNEFYITTLLGQVREFVSYFSDMVVIDTTRVLETTRMLWLVRYKVAFPGNALYCINEQSPESVFLGYSSVLSVVDFKFIEDNLMELVLINNELNKIFQELTGTVSTESNIRIGK